MKLAVTGGTGFVGRPLVAALLAQGHTVTVIARHPQPVPQSSPAALRVVAGDVTSPEISAALAGAEVIVHLAALSDASRSLVDPVGYTTVNALGTLQVLEAARQHSAGVVLASSQRVYQPWSGPQDETAPTIPTTIYGWSKLTAESWAAMYGRIYAVPTVILRPFTIYGPGQRAGSGASGVVAIFAERALMGQALSVHQRHQRDFVFIDDAVAAFAMAARRVRDAGVCGHIFNVGTGVRTDLFDLAHLIRERSGMKEMIAIEDHSADSTAEQREEVFAATGQTRRQLGWSATTPLTDGLDRYLAWLHHELALEGRR